MKRRDDDIVVHRQAPLQGILYTHKNTRKHLTTPSRPSLFTVFKSFFGFLFSLVAFPFYAAASLLKKRPAETGKAHEEIPDHKKNKRQDPVPVTETGNLSRVTTRAHQKEKTLFIMVSAACAAVCTASLIYIPHAFASKKLSVTINDSGIKVTALSQPKTIQALLDDCGIKIGEHDVVETDLNALLSSDMEIVIRRALPLTVSTADGDKEIYMLAGKVEEALKRAQVTPDENDEVYPDKESYVQPGMVIDVVSVDIRYETSKEKIGYKEVTRKSSDLKKGREVTVQQGKEGVREVKYEVVYKNGVQVSKTAVNSNVISKPVDEIVEIGTRTEVLMEETPRTSQIYSKTLYEHKKQLKPAPEIIDKILVADYVTAYTHTGHRTATGTYPRIGTVAVDPKKIPYGTKIYIPGYGYGRAEDTGAFRGKDFLQLDLFMDTEKDCYAWGRKRELKIYILK